MLLLLINILIIIVVGAICFYLIGRFVRDGRLGNLLKILVALICLAAIVQRLLPTLGVNFQNTPAPTKLNGTWRSVVAYLQQTTQIARRLKLAPARTQFAIRI